MARRKDDINMDTVDEIVKDNESSVEQSKEVVSETGKKQKDVAGEPALTALELIFCSSNSGEEFLYFDAQGGVFTERSPEYILEKCKKVKNPKYGSK